jgi:TolA-binding protein
MDTLDDLLSKRRRGALSDAEERRLTAARRASSEYELALLAGDAFERDGAPAPGDPERLRQIIRAAERRSTGAPRRRFSRPALRTLGVVPVFVAAVAAASIGGYQLFKAPEAPGTPPTLLAPRAPEPAREAPPIEPTPEHAQPPIEPTPERAQPRTRSRFTRPEPQVSKPSRFPLPATEHRPHEPGSAETAQSLFRRANTLRQLDWPAAAETYAELIRRFPGSLEAAIAEVALGKWSLAQGRSGDALEWFRAHQRRPQRPLAAEALWGEARALESLGSSAAAKRPWQQLLEQYPESPYAGVARERLGGY